MTATPSTAAAAPPTAAVAAASPDRKSRNNNNKSTTPRKNANATPVDHSNNSNSSDKDATPTLLLQQSIAAKASVALLHPQVTLTVYIPTTSVGAVIGRRGSTILQIQKQAQQSPHATGGPVRVSIVGHDEKDHASSSGETPTSTTTPTLSVPYTYSDLDWSCPEWTPVVIRADPNAAMQAAFQLQHLTEDNLDEVVLDLPISRQRHAALVGKRGLVLQNLSADTQVRIMVPRKDKRHDVVQLEGDLTKVQICLERILALACEYGNHKKNNNQKTAAPNSTPQPQESDFPMSETLTVSTLPPQTKLRQIGRKTETHIRRKKEQDEWILTVFGNSNHDIQTAMGLILKFLQQSNNNNNNSTTDPQPQQRPKRPRNNKTPRGRNNNKTRGGGGTSGASNNHNKNDAATATTAAATAPSATEPTSS